ncbi:hypothetical protein ACLB1T_00385 [Escherichia coli]
MVAVRLIPLSMGELNIYPVVGNAIETTIENGFQEVSNGGSATSTVINAGFQNISSGGSATSTIINAGFQDVSRWQCYQHHY